MVLATALLLLLLLVPPLGSAQQLQDQHRAAQRARFAIGIKISPLGAGFEMARRVTATSDIRAGFNMFEYSRPFHSDGLTYTADLNLRSAQFSYDWFPFGNPFHLSPGLLLYNGNRATANLSVPSGHLFRLDHNTYRSNPKDPIRGSTSVSFRKVAPAMLLGWGNLLGRRSHKFSVPFEFGVVFHGQPDFTFDLIGSGCDSQNRGCSDITSNSEAKQDILQERDRIRRAVTAFKYYPVLSVGLAYSF